jgi:3-oxoacyl-[acyl-carrier-protein] synthase II
MTDPVVVTGIGVVTPLGDDVDAVFDRIVAGEHAARRWPDLEAAGFPIAVANRVDDRDVLDPDPHRRGRELAQRALDSALADAGLARSDLVAAGVYVGSTMGESAAFETAGEGAAADLDDAGVDTFARHVGALLGTIGPVRAYGTACAAGNYAIGSAARALANGRVDVAVAGGVDPFSRIAQLGFARARAMASERCRPFDRNRRGMQLGEGAALLVLERQSSAERRGAAVLATIGALGLSGDAHHPTAPRPDGSGIAVAIESALKRSGVTAGEVGWVNAHGTGTAASDAAEAAALSTVFGASGCPPVSSLKGALGHCMGAASAIEAALTVVALERGVIPPTTGLDEPDEALAIGALAEPLAARRLRWALNCGYAFGGLNSALLLGVPGASPDLGAVVPGNRKRGHPDRGAVVATHTATGPAGADLAAWAAAELAALGWQADGLYVATATAGRAESVEFWRTAQETGLAFANPRLFPWTLANSPTGALAKALDVRGPTYTLVGGVEALEAAGEHAADDVADGIVTAAAIVHLDVADGTPGLSATLRMGGALASGV